MSVETKEKLSASEAVNKAWNYPLFDAIFNRRSRRFSKGAEVPGGPTKYKSKHEPYPLDEVEEALLSMAGTGISGMNLSDLPYRDDRDRSAGGNTMIQFTGRTWPSPCGSHGTELFYWNDEGVYLLKLHDIPPEKIREYQTVDDRDRLLQNFRECRVKLQDGRLEHPRSYPTMLPFNIWDSNISGSTMFLPVTNVTFQYINSLILMCGWPDGGLFPIDDRNGNVACGCQRWADDGLLDPRKAVALSALEEGGASGMEAGFIIQNLNLAAQAMGLGGWVHASAAAMVIMGGTPLAKGLGFRFVTPKIGRIARGGFSGGSIAPSPVGIDGVLECYAPPYYKNMDAAVDAVIANKFGPKGIYTPGSGMEAPFLDRNEFIAGVPRYSDKLIQCVKDICNYIYDTYGKFPGTADAMVSRAWFQAHHLDLEFYDKFFQPGAYTDAQLNHMKLWHGHE